MARVKRVSATSAAKRPQTAGKRPRTAGKQVPHLPKTTGLKLTIADEAHNLIIEGQNEFKNIFTESNENVPVTYPLQEFNKLIDAQQPVRLSIANSIIKYKKALTKLKGTHVVTQEEFKTLKDISLPQKNKLTYNASYSIHVSQSWILELNTRLLNLFLVDDETIKLIRLPEYQAVKEHLMESVHLLFITPELADQEMIDFMCCKLPASLNSQPIREKVAEGTGFLSDYAKYCRIAADFCYAFGNVNQEIYAYALPLYTLALELHRLALENRQLGLNASPEDTCSQACAERIKTLAPANNTTTTTTPAVTFATTAPAKTRKRKRIVLEEDEDREKDDDIESHPEYGQKEPRSRTFTTTASQQNSFANSQLLARADKGGKRLGTMHPEYGQKKPRRVRPETPGSSQQPPQRGSVGGKGPLSTLHKKIFGTPYVAENPAESDEDEVNSPSP